MKFLSSLNLSRKNKNDAETTAQEDQSEVKTIRKVKIIGAFLVFGFALWVANWIQTPLPDDLQTDVLSDQGNQSKTEAAKAPVKEVGIIDFSFDPPMLTIEKGTTVVWTNKDTSPHTVTGKGFSSGTLLPGQTFSHTFQEEETFDYNCSFHPQMKGKVVVASGAVPVKEPKLSDAQPQAPVEGSATQPQAPVEPETPTAQNGNTSTAPTDTLHNSPDSEKTETSVKDTIADTSVTLDNEVPEGALPDPPSENIATVSVDPQALLSQLTDTVNPEKEPAAVDTQSKIEPKAAADSAQEKVPRKLAQSGPEDMIYVAALGIILYVNRRKVLSLL